MLTYDCREYAVRSSILAVSKAVYCVVTEYVGPRESSHVGLEIA